MLSDPLRQTALGDAPEIACPFCAHPTTI